MDFPKGLKYTKDHEWVRAEDGEVTVGITQHAADQLGDVTYVEPPELGTSIKKGETAGCVESVKAASDVYAPVSGHVVEVNETLEAQPELVNQSPYEDGWFFKLDGVAKKDLADLLDAKAYTAYVGECEE
jgi:glycine cleavage system H protein